MFNIKNGAKTCLFGLCCTVLLVSCTGGTGNSKNNDLSGQQKTQSKGAEINLKLGVEYMRRQQYDTALEKLKRALTDDENYADAHNAIAILYERLGRFEQSSTHYKKAVSLNPSDSNIQNNYGQYLCRQGHWAEAEKHFLRAIDNPLYKKTYVPYVNAGICTLRHKQYEKAESYFRKALKAFPDFSVALFQMAKLNYETGNYSYARNYLERYLHVAQQTPQTLLLGIKIARQLNDRDTETQYSLLLRSKYPDAEEVQQLKQLMH